MTTVYRISIILEVIIKIGRSYKPPLAWTLLMGVYQWRELWDLLLLELQKNLWFYSWERKRRQWILKTNGPQLLFQGQFCVKSLLWIGVFIHCDIRITITKKLHLHFEIKTKGNSEMVHYDCVQETQLCNIYAIPVVSNGVDLILTGTVREFQFI